MHQNPSYQTTGSIVDSEDETEDIYEEVDTIPLSPNASDDLQYPLDSVRRSNRKGRSRKKSLCLFATVLACVIVLCLAIIALLVFFTIKTSLNKVELMKLKKQLANQSDFQMSHFTSLYNRLNKESDTQRVELELLAQKYQQVLNHHPGCIEENRKCTIDMRNRPKNIDYLYNQKWADCSTRLMFINTTIYSVAGASCKNDIGAMELEVSTIKTYKNSTGTYMLCTCLISDPKHDGSFNSIPVYYQTGCEMVVRMCPLW